jgi:mannose-6-phosphate isomerase
MYPFKFRPIFKERIWGGQKLSSVFGKEIPAGIKIGESWELADLAQNKSVIGNGALAGMTLADAVRQFAEAITGKRQIPDQFPLLIKLLDCEDVLSVQVHPDVAACRRLGKGDVKTESWYIIDAEPGAVIYKGLKAHVTKESFQQAIAEGNVEGMLQKITVQKGECHFLPAGTLHAIGAGLLIAEIQTPSDTTYRVFDWNRVDENGRSRTLHISEALESIHFDATEDDLSVRTEGRLVDSEFFKIDKVVNKGDDDLLPKDGRIRVLVFIKGSGTINGGAEEVPFRAGDTLLVPASVCVAIRSVRGTEYLSVRL